MLVVAYLFCFVKVIGYCLQDYKKKEKNNHFAYKKIKAFRILFLAKRLFVFWFKIKTSDYLMDDNRLQSLYFMWRYAGTGVFKFPLLYCRFYSRSILWRILPQTDLLLRLLLQPNCTAFLLPRSRRE